MYTSFPRGKKMTVKCLQSPVVYVSNYSWHWVLRKCVQRVQRVWGSVWDQLHWSDPEWMQWGCGDVKTITNQDNVVKRLQSPVYASNYTVDIDYCGSGHANACPQIGVQAVEERWWWSRRFCSSITVWRFWWVLLVQRVQRAWEWDRFSLTLGQSWTTYH